MNLRGFQDELVPTDHMTRLYKAATGASERTIARFANGMHNDTWTDPEYWKLVAKFITEKGAARKPASSLSASAL